MIIAATAIATVIAVLIVLNLSLGDKQIDARPTRLFGVDDPQFPRTMDGVLSPALVPGNRIEQLLNGDQIFPAMLDAIHSARHTVTFETYIFWSGTIGKEFADALSERARHGVKVHVLLDWIGGEMDRTDF